MWSNCSQLLGHEGQQRPPETCNCAISMPLGRMLHFAATHCSSLGAPDSMGCYGAQWNGYGLCWVFVGHYESLWCPMSSCAALWDLMGQLWALWDGLCRGLWGVCGVLRCSYGALLGGYGALWGLMGLYGRAFPWGPLEEAVGRNFLRQQTLWGHC